MRGQLRGKKMDGNDQREGGIGSIELFTSGIPSGLVSRNCYRIVPCRASPHPTYPKNLGVRSVYGLYWTGHQGNEFKLIPTVKWKLDIL